jgi:hypothetical protein
MSNAALERMLFTPPGFIVAERLRPEPDWAHIRGLGRHQPGVRLVGHLVPPRGPGLVRHFAPDFATKSFS